LGGLTPAALCLAGGLTGFSLPVSCPSFDFIAITIFLKNHIKLAICPDISHFSQVLFSRFVIGKNDSLYTP